MRLLFAHVQKTVQLPWHHRDPFDRVLIAQAQRDGLHFVTDDAAILRYDVNRIEI